MQNNSGIEPLDVRVLVLPDPVEDKVGSIFIPQQEQERQQFAQVKATMVAAGVNAWVEAKASPAFKAPEPGARVLIAKYGGINVTGDDGATYRIMNDADVTAVLGG